MGEPRQVEVRLSPLAARLWRTQLELVDELQVRAQELQARASTGMGEALEFLSAEAGQKIPRGATFRFEPAGVVFSWPDPEAKPCGCPEPAGEVRQVAATESSDDDAAGERNRAP